MTFPALPVRVTTNHVKVCNRSNETDDSTFLVSDQDQTEEGPAEVNLLKELSVFVNQKLVHKATPEGSIRKECPNRSKKIDDLAFHVSNQDQADNPVHE